MGSGVEATKTSRTKGNVPMGKECVSIRHDGQVNALRSGDDDQRGT
jgi:hypothetical protein